MIAPKTYTLDVPGAVLRYDIRRNGPGTGPVDGEALDIPPDSIIDIPPGHDGWVVGDEPWATIEWTSAHLVGIGPESPGERVVATVLFNDIVDSTAMIQSVGDAAWKDLLRRHDISLRNDLKGFRGREVSTTGDGFLAVFDGATRADRCVGRSRRGPRLVHDEGSHRRVGTRR